MAAQAATMRLGGIPNDLLINLNPIANIVLIPLYAEFIYPGIKRLGLRFTPVRRISAGFGFAAFGMVYAAVLQHFIYMTNPCGKHASACLRQGQRSHLSVWIQVPVYLAIANSEILACVTATQYAYSQAPKNMRSLVMAIFLLMGGVGSVMGQGLIPLASDPYLVWNYASLAAMCAIAAFGILWTNAKGKEKSDRSAKNNGSDMVHVGTMTLRTMMSTRVVH
jgi:proton-dependent oligopeptide transporter, POT family